MGALQIIVEHRDRGTRFGWNYITTLMEAQQRRIEAIFPDETKEDLVADCGFVRDRDENAARNLALLALSINVQVSDNGTNNEIQVWSGL